MPPSVPLIKVSQLGFSYRIAPVPVNAPLVPLFFTSQYHFPLLTPNVLAIKAYSGLLQEPLYVVPPSVVYAEVVAGVNPFRVQKLFVGVSVAWSADVMLFSVKLLPLPLASSPK